MNKINYRKLAEITVKSQDELDAIPDDFSGIIYIEFGTAGNKAVVNKIYRNRVVALENSFVETWGNSSVEAWDESSVVARDDSSILARGKSSVEAWDESSVEAWDESSVKARGKSSVVARGKSSVEVRENSSVLAWGKSSVKAWGKSSVEAWGKSSVEAWGKSSVEARDSSSVMARDESSVEAYGNSSVVARDDNSVVAWENSSVVALGNSSVVARGNSSVEARDESSVEAYGNAQVVDMLQGGRIEISGNARIVYMPKTIEEYCSFYGIKHNKKTGKFFKCVHKREDGVYFSDYEAEFTYAVGKKVSADCLDEDPTEICGHGIHISYLTWALSHGTGWDDLAILEVEADLDGIVLPDDYHGMVRCAEVTVLREVPLEECGIYGQILAKRRKTDGKDIFRLA